MLISAFRAGRAGRADQGFSMIELMVTLAVAAVLLGAAVPAVNSWVADARVRSAADTLQNAIRLAQAEAIRRSRPAVLMLTNESPAAGATPIAGGRRWVVRLLQRNGEIAAEAAAGGNSSTHDELFLRGGTEAASMGVTVDGPALICFNAFGQRIGLSSSATAVGAACSVPSKPAHPTTYTLSRSGGSRSLVIQVGIGGRVRLCDPGKVLSNSTPEGCSA